jgi:pimeloyl-ACP methyl ester carboxylesterase
MNNLFYSILAGTFLAGTGFVHSAERGEPATVSTEAKSHFVKVGTNRVHYVIEGKAKQDIVLVHCWAGNLSFWNEQLPALTNKARVVLIDLPGHGKSDKPHTAYTMDFFAEAVLAVMKDAHVSKATLVGHSMGTPAICRVYKQAPEKVTGLVAVDGTLRRPKMTPEQAERFVAGFRAPDYRENVRQFMGALFPTPGTEAVRDRVISEMLETPQYVMVGAMDGMFGADQPDWDPGHVSVPVMVINAPNRMWTDEYKEYVKGLSAKTDYQAIEGVGHWLMLEKPAAFNAALVGMLGKFELMDK